MLTAHRAAQQLLRRHPEEVRGLPIPIVSIAEKEGWHIDYAPLWDALGYAVVLGPYRRMTIDDTLSIPSQRLVIAHEVIHVERGDTAHVQVIGPKSTSSFEEWLHDRNERAAWKGAATLLVPLGLLDVIEMESIEDIAAACRVPPFLVGLALEGV